VRCGFDCRTRHTTGADEKRRESGGCQTRTPYRAGPLSFPPDGRWGFPNATGAVLRSGGPLTDVPPAAGEPGPAISAVRSIRPRRQVSSGGISEWIDSGLRADRTPIGRFLQPCDVGTPGGHRLEVWRAPFRPVDRLRSASVVATRRRVRWPPVRKRRVSGGVVPSPLEHAGPFLFNARQVPSGVDPRA
jgi:hypothetical protein